MSDKPAASEPSHEERILRMVKKTLTEVAKDTFTPPGMRHPLSDDTINHIRDCLDLIISRERELAEERGETLSDRPHFTDEPQANVVVQLDMGSKKKKDD
jgi:hypothetical protein